MSRDKEQTLTIRIGAEIAGALSGVNRLGESFDKLGRNMQRTGRTLTRNLTAPILGVGAAGFKVAGDFERALGRMEGLVGIQRSQLDAWQGDIRDLSVEYGQSAGKTADALFFITSAGLRGSDAMDALEASLKGSASGLGEVSTIADLATSAMNAYASENLTAGQATDVLTAAVREGKLEPPELAAAMGKVLPVSSAMGVGFDQVGAAMAAMSRTGTGAAEGATQLRSILTSLLQPTAEAEATLGQMGLSARGLREQIREKGLLSVLQTLDGRFRSNDDAAAKVFGNVRALSGVLDMMGGSADTTAQIFGALENSSGSLDSAFEVQQGGMFQLQRAWVSLQNTALELGQVVLPPVTAALSVITGVLQRVTAAFGTLSPQVQTMIITVGGVVAAVGPFLLVMGKVVAVLGLVLSPAGLVIAALATLTTVVVTLVQNWDRFLVFWIDLWTSVQEMALGSIGRIIGGIQELTDGIPGLGSVVGAVSEQFDAFAERSLAATNAAADRLRARLSGTVHDLSETGATARSLADSVNGLGQEVNTTTGGIQGMQDGVRGLRPELEDLQGGLVGVQGRLREIAPAMVQVTGTVSDRMGAATRSVGRFSVDAGNDLADLAKDGGMAMSDLGRTMKSIAGRGADAIFDFATGARNAIRSFVVDALRQLARLAASRLFKLAIGGLTGGAGGVLGGLFGGFFADGGVLGAGRWGIAGEDGAELVSAGAAPVRITPLSDIGGGGGGGGGNVAAQILDRIGPPPRVHTPEGVAADAWWRQAFDALARDGHRRGSL